MFFASRLSLVTGGTGFIGTHIAAALVEQGGRVRVTVHERTPILSHPLIETVHADLTRQDDCVAAMRDVDLVFHAAGAVSGVGVQEVGAMAGITANLTLTAQVLQAAWAVGVERILIFSSSTAYPVVDHPVREEELWLGAPHQAYFGYGWMRRYFERLAEFVASRSNIKVALIRPTAVYGPHDDFHPTTGHVVPALVRKAVEKRDPFEVWGTGDEQRDFLHVADFARACLMMIERYATCDPVNIGYGSSVTIRRIVEIVLAAAGHSGADVRFDATRPTAIPVRLVDTTKAAEVLAFTPRIPLEVGLRDLVHWYAAKRGTPLQ